MIKRKPLFLAIAFFVSMSAALLGVNWRLNNPPFSSADSEFRASIAGADSVTVRQKDLRGPVAGQMPTLVFAPLDAAQTRELVAQLRFVGDDSSYNLARNDPLEIAFLARGRVLARFELYQSPLQSELEDIGIHDRVYQLHPRFEKSLRRLLDQFAPRRVRP